MDRDLAYPAMWSDVVDLRDFYGSSLGQVAQRLIRRQLRRIWPDLAGMRVLGLGFATPFLRIFLAEAERVIAVMPASQGVLPWPAEGPGLTERAMRASDVRVRIPMSRGTDSLNVATAAALAFYERVRVTG